MKCEKCEEYYTETSMDAEEEDFHICEDWKVMYVDAKRFIEEQGYGRNITVSIPYEHVIYLMTHYKERKV